MSPATNEGFGGEQRGGLGAFGAVWFGQLVSIVGSALTTFALGLWVYRTRGSLTDFALVGFATVLPRVALSPIAGAIVDRGSRRRIMLLTSSGGGLVSGALALLVWSGTLDVWHVYAAAAANGALASLEWPAWSAATTVLVPARQLGRASGLVSLAGAASDILGPILAALLLASVGMETILGLDVASFVVACASLALVRFPEPPPSPRRGRRLELGEGFRFIRADAGLAMLVAFMVSFTFEWAIVGALVAPMVLGYASTVGLGQVLSVAGLGALAGSVAMTITGGGRRRILALVAAEVVSGVAFVAMGLSQAVLPMAAAVLVAHVTIPIIAGSTQVIWQRRVPPEMQGRVFAARQMIERAPAPLAFLAAGPLAESVFGPVLRSPGPAGSALRSTFGAGGAREIGLMFALMGVAQVAIALGFLASARMRGLDPEAEPIVPSPAAADEAHAAAL